MDDALLLKKLRDYLFEQGKLSTVFKPPILSMEPYLSRALSRAINSIQRPDAARAEIAALRARLDAIKDAGVHLPGCASNWCKCGRWSYHPAHNPDKGSDSYHRFDARPGDCLVCCEEWGT